MNINPEHECKAIKEPMRKTQKDWIEYFNQKGEKMISASDIYRVAKEENKGLIESLQQDFKDSVVVTSTRIIYNKDNLDAEIIHDAGSTIQKPKKCNVLIPIYSEEIKENPETEAYLQALFDTKDKLDEIIKVLNRFDKDKRIYLWTPSQSSRRDEQARSVLLYFDSIGGFNVIGFSRVDDDDGLSRGVVVGSAKQTKKGDLK